jgi:Arc/MetJ-type ribon-helix-helix transcriptional regulator
MTVHLTPEQEERVQAIIHTGAYRTVQDVLDAGLAAVEQKAAGGFEGAEQELEGLLLRGLDSQELAEGEFWNSVDQETDALLSRHERGMPS